MVNTVLTKVLIGLEDEEQLEDIQTEIICQLENKPSPYPLTLIKVDSAGNKIKGDYTFNITLDNVNTKESDDGKYGIHINKKYLQGYSSTDDGDIIINTNTVKVKTDENGEIKIAAIYAKSLDSKVTVKEVSSTNEMFSGDDKTNTQLSVINEISFIKKIINKLKSLFH